MVSVCMYVHVCMYGSLIHFTNVEQYLELYTSIFNIMLEYLCPFAASMEEEYQKSLKGLVEQLDRLGDDHLHEK